MWGILIMDNNPFITAGPTDADAVFIPTRGRDANYPVVTYFLDLNQMYMGAIRWHWHDEFEIIIIRMPDCLFNGASFGRENVQISCESEGQGRYSLLYRQASEIFVRACFGTQKPTEYSD